MKIFYIKRETNKGNIYRRTTNVWKCFLWWKVKLIYSYGIRIHSWYVPGVRQAIQPIGYFWKASDRVPPATNRWESEYIIKEMFTNLKTTTTTLKDNRH